MTTLFVDTNVLIYSRSSPLSEYRDPCLEILAAIGHDEADAQISTAVLEELWHLELTGRLGAIEGLTAAAHELFTPVLPITDDVLTRALALPEVGIGAKDRIHVATCLENGIERIVTADRGFDTVGDLQRIDPRVGAALFEQA